MSEPIIANQKCKCGCTNAATRSGFARGCKLRGRKQNWTPESRAKQSEHLRQLWRCGRYKKVPEALAQGLRNRIAAGLNKGAGRDRMIEISKLRDLEKMNRKSRARLTGGHGLGRASRDHPNHVKAAHWIIRDPVGTIHELDNLQSWARKNEQLFLPDQCPQATTPLWLRFVYGINNLKRNDGKAGHSWRGWTLVSMTERAFNGAPDLLARNQSNE